MFTKQDYLKYFTQIKKIEKGMGDGFRKCAERVDDPEIKKFFTQMSREETAHSRVADAMIEMFGGKPE